MTTLLMVNYDDLTAAVAAVLPSYLAINADVALFDYWSATEAACLRLGTLSTSALGNLVDGMIVDAVEAKWGKLPDVRTGEVVVYAG